MEVRMHIYHAEEQNTVLFSSGPCKWSRQSDKIDISAGAQCGLGICSSFPSRWADRGLKRMQSALPL